jgi:hypothetical protein
VEREDREETDAADGKVGRGGGAVRERVWRLFEEKRGFEGMFVVMKYRDAESTLLRGRGRGRGGDEGGGVFNVDLDLDAVNPWCFRCL